jgi:Transposase DDE domain
VPQVAIATFEQHIGLIIAVVVVAASVHDNAIGTALLDKVASSTSTVSTALVDQGFKTSVVEHGRTLGIDVQIVARSPAPPGSFPHRSGGGLSRPTA